MSKEYLQIANDPLMWLMCLPAVAIVLFQVFLISKRAIAAASVVNMSRQEAMRAFKAGLVSGIGPASAVLIVMVAMMSVLGGPITWLRTVIIGAASTELTAATIGGQVMGVEFGGAGYGITEYANSIILMVLNGTGWLLLVGLFTHKLGDIQNKISGGNVKLLGVIGATAIVASFAYLVSSHLLKGGASLLTAIVSGIAMILLNRVTDKVPQLTEHTLGIAMVIGMIAGTLIS